MYTDTLLTNSTKQDSFIYILLLPSKIDLESKVRLNEK